MSLFSNENLNAAMLIDGNKIPKEIVVHLDLSAPVAKHVFVADDNYEVVAVKEIHSVVGGASAALQLEKLTGTTALGSGTAMMSATISGTSTINTVQSGALNGDASDQLAAGDHIGLKPSGTQTGYVGCVDIFLRRI